MQNNILKSILSTLRTFATIAICYGIYSMCSAWQIRVPTLQEILSANAIVWTKSDKPKQLKTLQAAEIEAQELEAIAQEIARNSAGRADVADVCRLTKLGYQVTDAQGRLELCIDKGVYINGGAK